MARKTAPTKAIEPEASAAASTELQSRAITTLDAVLHEVIDRLMSARERYPYPPIALGGERLRQAAKDYALLGIALEHLLRLKDLEPAADRWLSADPSNALAKRIKQGTLVFETLPIVASVSLVPCLKLSAVARGLDPSPFEACNMHLTAESRAKALALADHLSLLAEQCPDATPLPELKAHDRQAWQLATLHGMTQAKVAEELNKQYGTTYSQGQVSRMIARATTHAQANGLAEIVPKPIDPPRTIDPNRLELGQRVDRRRPRPSDMARENDDNE